MTGFEPQPQPTTTYLTLWHFLKFTSELI